MRLVGTYRSPFTRRVAVSLQLLGIPYEITRMTAWSHFGDVMRLNPLAQIPILELDDGELLFDSSAILDYLDQTVGPERALVPAAAEERKRVLRAVTLALGIMEKGRLLLYERTLRPSELRYEPWIERWISQTASGLTALESMTWRPWLCCDRISQADVSVGVMYHFTRRTNPDLLPDGRYPALDGLGARCADHAAFVATTPEPD